MEFLLILMIVALLWLYFYLPVSMARKRGRSAVAWVLLFLIISPFWGIILLLILGDSARKIRKDIIEELRRN